jgi:hypothetical protein
MGNSPITILSRISAFACYFCKKIPILRRDTTTLKWRFSWFFSCLQLTSSVIVSWKKVRFVAYRLLEKVKFLFCFYNLFVVLFTFYD